MDKRDEKTGRFPKIKRSVPPADGWCGGLGAKVRRPCARVEPSADSRLRARRPRSGRPGRLGPGRPLQGPLDQRKPAAAGPGANGQAHPRQTPTRSQRPPLSSCRGAMRPPPAARCPGRAPWAPWRAFLPVVLALLADIGHAQRNSAGRYEPVRDASPLWRPAGNHPAAVAAKVYSLFREQDPPVSGSLPAEQTRPAWGSPRRPAEAEARRSSRAQQLRRALPPVQTRRSSPAGPQQPAPRARVAPALPSLGTSQRPGVPPRGRLTG